MEIHSIGTYLKEMRESKGISFNDAQQRTKISAYYLRAIEDDEFEKLPAPAYAKGFLKIYADFLGADREWVVEQYLRSHVGESKQVLVLEGESLETKNMWQAIKALNPKIIAGIVSGIVVLFILLRILFHTTPDSIMKGELNEGFGWKPDAEIIQPKDIPTPAPVAAPVRETKKMTRLSLEGIATEDVWIRVQADNKLIFEQILKKGAKETWYASDELKVRVGNSDNIDFIYNGEPTKKLSPSGKVLNIRFTEKGWWASD